MKMNRVDLSRDQLLRVKQFSQAIKYETEFAGRNTQALIKETKAFIFIKLRVNCKVHVRIVSYDEIIRVKIEPELFALNILNILTKGVKQ